MTIEKAARADFLYVSANLREEDLVETVLATGRIPSEVLHSGLEAYAVLYRGLPVALFGVEEDGRAWFLATPEVEKLALSVLKAAPIALNALSAPYPDGLYAYAWEENDMHLRWAEAVGFTYQGKSILRGNTFHNLHRPRQD